ncbi:glycosyltransferase family 2 protein [Plantibacter flavus]|uniref:glycosyltransferase family 2 protein n=1 Tax=Plantibacter flavus TaxID=150123 RepID=UPI003391946D
MSEHPLVTIILTFYNNEEYVDQAISLVEAQTFRDFELIVVDDGSRDSTPSLIVERTRTMDRVRLFLKDTNAGIAAARNSAVELARGEYTWFLDCDDSWSPEILEKLVASVTGAGSDIAVCRAVRTSTVDADDAVLLDGVDHAVVVDRAEAIDMLLRGTIRGYLWNKLIRTTLLRENPFPLLSSQSDLAGVTQIIGQVDRVSFVPEQLYWHLVRHGSITNSRNPRLENMEYCWRAIRQLAIGSGAYDEDDELLVYFDYWHYFAAVVNTFYRVGSDDPIAAKTVRNVRSRMNARGIRTVAKYDRRLSLIIALIKYTGPAYPAIYLRYRAVARS